MEWRESALGLLYEACGESGRRYVIAANGEAWTLDLLVDGDYQTEQATEPQAAPTLAEAQRAAQEWENELW